MVSGSIRTKLRSVRQKHRAGSVGQGSHAISARREGWFLGRLPRIAPQRGAARFGQILEDAGPPTPQEHLVPYRRPIPRLPHCSPAQGAAGGGDGQILEQRRGEGPALNGARLVATTKTCWSCSPLPPAVQKLLLVRSEERRV